MYTYLQRPGCKKVKMATYVHTGGVSNAYSHIRTARARVHGWVGTEKLHRRRVHGESTSWVGTECVVVFIGRAWTEQPMETRPGVPQNGGKRPPTVETGVLLIGRGVAYRKMEETDLLRSKRGLVDREECGIPQNGGNELVLERYGQNGGSCSSGGVWGTAKQDSTCNPPL